MDPEELQPRTAGQARRWACIVGLNHYQSDLIDNLRYCASDAQAVSDLLILHPEYGYEPDRVRLLVSNETERTAANKLSILSNLIEMAEATEREDLLLFYFAGRGETINGEAYLLPADTHGRLLVDTAISLRRVKEIVRGAAARARVIILDTCHRGGKIRHRAIAQDNEAFIKSVFEESEGIAILASSTRDELAWEDPGQGHGVFTYYLLEGLAGAANTRPDKLITLDQAAAYVTDKVKNWANLNQATQQPALDFKGVGEVVLLAAAGRVVEATQTAAVSLEPEHENPINGKFPAPVRDKKDFYGRQAELRRIAGVLNVTTDKPIIIQGERGIGKTSLLNRVKQLLKEDRWSGRRFFYASIEPSGVFSCVNFATEMWHGLLRCLQEAGASFSPELETSFQFDTFGRFASQLDRLQAYQPDITFVIFLDELDKVFHQCDDLEQKRILGLMRYIIEATDFPLVFLISVLRDLPAFYGSPFPTDKIILYPFERDDMNQMVKGLLKGYASIGDAELVWLYEYTGGHPYFVKLLLVKLFGIYRLSSEKQKVTADMVQAAAQLAKRSQWADDVLRDIYQTYLNDGERYILLWLANNKNGLLTAKEIVETGLQLGGVLDGLVKRGYLDRRADSSYRFKIGFQRDWLRDWPEYGVELERLQVPGQAAPPPPESDRPARIPEHIVPHGICIDLTTQRVYVEGREVANNLTDLEYRALCYLSEHSGQVVAKDEFANFIWGEPYYEGDDQRIFQLIHRLRVLLNDQKRPYQYLETLRKRGFRLQQARLVRTGSDRQKG